MSIRTILALSLGIVLAPGPSWLRLSMILFGVSGSLWMVSASPFMMENSTEEERNALFSANFGLQTLVGFGGTLVGGYLPDLSARRSRHLHRWVGGLLVACVVLHVVGLWITSPPDVIDALLDLLFEGHPSPTAEQVAAKNLAIMGQPEVAATLKPYWFEPKGKTNLDALVAAGLLPADVDQAFLCGPLELTNAARDALVAAGLPSERIHRELFTGAQLGSPPPMAPQAVDDTMSVVDTASNTVVDVIAQVMLGSMAGYAFARLKFPGRNIIFFILLAFAAVTSIIAIIEPIVRFAEGKWNMRRR